MTATPTTIPVPTKKDTPLIGAPDTTAQQQLLSHWQKAVKDLLPDGFYLEVTKIGCATVLRICYNKQQDFQKLPFSNGANYASVGIVTLKKNEGTENRTKVEIRESVQNIISNAKKTLKGQPPKAQS
jgi:hypothetical protein